MSKAIAINGDDYDIVVLADPATGSPVAPGAGGTVNIAVQRSLFVDAASAQVWLDGDGNFYDAASGGSVIAPTFPVNTPGGTVSVTLQRQPYKDSAATPLQVWLDADGLWYDAPTAGSALSPTFPVTPDGSTAISRTPMYSPIYATVIPGGVVYQDLNGVSELFYDSPVAGNVITVTDAELLAGRVSVAGISDVDVIDSTPAGTAVQRDAAYAGDSSVIYWYNTDTGLREFRNPATNAWEKDQRYTEGSAHVRIVGGGSNFTPSNYAASSVALSTAGTPMGAMATNASVLSLGFLSVPATPVFVAFGATQAAADAKVDATVSSELGHFVKITDSVAEIGIPSGFGLNPFASVACLTASSASVMASQG